VTNNFGIFQVKYNFRDMASVELIRRSVEDLKVFVTSSDTIMVKMNFPGIGYGGLTKETVMPLLDILPWYVKICYR
jgi:hypothetical protein